MLGIKRRALFVGIDEYAGGLPALTCAGNDALRLRDAFTEAGYETAVLRNAATHDILKQIETLTRDLTKDDLFLFFFAGHGFTAERQDDSGKPRLDRQLAGKDDLRWRLLAGKDGIGLDDLKYMTENVGCPRVVILDACQTMVNVSRGFDESVREACTERDLKAILEVISRAGKKGPAAPFVVINSCDVGEVSYEMEEDGNGLFSRALLEVLGETRANGERPSFDEAFVKRIAGRMAECGKRSQHPTFLGSVQDISIFPETEDELTPGAEMQVNLSNGVTMTFCWCPATTGRAWKAISNGSDCFQMGGGVSDPCQREDERTHPVRLTHGFWIGKWPVTQRQWVALTGENPVPGRLRCDEFPILNVSWSDCQDCLSRLNSRQKRYRFSLPTEAQWEYACRAGTQTPYAFGVCLESCVADFDGQALARPKQSCALNKWGIGAMHGSVWEWCQDFYGEYGESVDPSGPLWGDFRVCRGGSWFSAAEECRSARRGRSSPDCRATNLGLRLVCSEGCRR